MYEDCPICRRDEARYEIRDNDGRVRFVCKICFEIITCETKIIRRPKDADGLETNGQERSKLGH